ncbi:MAG: hypothetical protein IT423_22695 [Pirellulaceae bacterium]|nr:hypothetical protein [Pirellulaceae bacterium]
MEEVPFEDRFVPKVEVDWERSFWWWYPITRAIHPAMRMASLVISSLGVVMMLEGVRLADWLFAPRFGEQFANVYVRSLANIPLAPIEGGQSQLFSAIGLRELAYLTFCLLWLTVVLGFFGGILSRRAAVELGQRTIAPWGVTVRLVASRLLSYMWVTGLHLVAISVLLILPFVLGLVARLGPLAYVAGALLLLMYPLVVVIGRLVLSMFVCYPLAVTAISCERNADAFEGFSRSNNYFFQRPVVAVLASAALFGIGWVGYMIVFWWLLAGWHWMRDAFLTGAGLTTAELFTGPRAEGATDGLQAARLTTWVVAGAGLTWWIIAAYWFSYFWSATAAVYLILRRSVDNTDLDEIDAVAASDAASLPNIPPPPNMVPTDPGATPTTNS